MGQLPVVSPPKKPAWLKIRLNTAGNFQTLKTELRARNLATVCEEARCPNIYECWAEKTATLMLLGDTCTRACRFCSVQSGNPAGYLDPEEANKTADTVQLMGLSYVVLTCVDRDDLADGGAEALRQIVERVAAVNPNTRIETLVGDFAGNERSLSHFLNAPIDVYAHNVETVERLTPAVRDRRAGYRQSLRALEAAKKMVPTLFTKSSIMVGLGETQTELLQTMRDLRSVDVDFLTIGQYLQPTSRRRHLPVHTYVPPDVFLSYEAEGMAMGFKYVAAGPLVRSSYRAGEFFIKSILDAQLPKVSAP